VPRGQRDGSLRPYSRFSRQEPLLIYQVAPQLYSRGCTTKKNTESLTDASKEVGLEIDAEKTKYMLLSHHQNHVIKI
jgi:hypothetical protein